MALGTGVAAVTLLMAGAPTSDLPTYVPDAAAMTVPATVRPAGTASTDPAPAVNSAANTMVSATETVARAVEPSDTQPQAEQTLASQPVAAPQIVAIVVKNLGWA